MIVMHLACNACRYRTASFVQYGLDYTTLVFQHQETHALRVVHRNGLRSWVQERLGRVVGQREADEALDGGLYAALVLENTGENEAFLSPMSHWPAQRTLAIADAVAQYRMGHSLWF